MIFPSVSGGNKKPEKNAVSYLVFDNDHLLAHALQARTKATVFRVELGDSFAQKDTFTWVIDIRREACFEKLFTQLSTMENFPLAVIHNFCSTPNPVETATIDDQLELGIYSLFYLSQQLLKYAKPSNSYKMNNKKLRLLFLHGALDGEKNSPLMAPAYSAIAAFCRSVTMEEPGFIYKSIGIQNGAQNSSKLIDDILAELHFNRDLDVEILYTESGRKIKNIKEIKKSDIAQIVDTHNEGFNIKENGTYVITGGLGSLGKLFSRYLAEKGKVNLALISRSPPTLDDQLFIADLEKTGSVVMHYCADVAKKNSIAEAIAAIKQRFSSIDGVLHSAGVAKDMLLLKKSFSIFKDVIRIKVHGSLFLYEATQNEALDFFILFSSISSVLGNIGQTDYAFASRFQDELAEALNCRSSTASTNTRYLSINWPLWEEGGMNIGEGQRQWLKDSIGLIPLSTKSGLDSMAAALRMDASSILIAQGVEDKLKKHFFSHNSGAKNFDVTTTSVEKKEMLFMPDRNNLIGEIESYVTNIIADELKIPVARLNPKDALENYGIDSNSILRMSREFEKKFGELSKTLFYEYHSIRELAGYFYENHAEKIDKKPVAPDIERFHNGDTSESITKIKNPDLEAISADDDAIAIIGVSGIYPGANDLNEFWENLQAGIDSISEIPEDRWDYNLYFDSDKNKKGKTYSKWGGFLNDVKGFDPLFFNIPPKEANHIDPQERLFLQTAWHTIEDAGYTRQSLSTAKVGVFVGVMWGQYQLLGVGDTNLVQGVVPPPASFSSIANRVSYVMNFTGPSMAVDTMCSSSLTAIHLARRAILASECDYAVAGGVNLIVHPARYLQLCYEKFLSSDGRCRSFGAGGDGYVPGEGVGAVLLKRLSKAIKDGDHIHGVLLATAINHGGKTSGYRVPNPTAQAEVIQTALAEAKIPAHTLSYIESHGTGTPLGDPIEIVGLKNGLGEFLQPLNDGRKIAIGSVKSNVGHLESAAGIAGLSKILLQLRNKVLVPSLHAEELNSHIPFAKGPFQVQRSLTPWIRPLNLDAEEIPLRATLSSFGAGGSNGHLIVEEYKPSNVDVFDAPLNVLVISARTQEQLNIYTGQVLQYFQNLSVEQHSQVDEQEDFSQKITAAVSATIGVNEVEINELTPLEELGFDHGLLIQLQNQLQQSGLKTNSGFELVIQDSIISLTHKLHNVLRFPHASLDNAEKQFHQICYTLQTGREAFNYRLAIIADGIASAISQLEKYKERPSNTTDDSALQGRVDLNQQHSFAVGAQHLSDFNFAHELAKNWVAGAEINWFDLYPSIKPLRITAPVYPFSKKPYWFNDDISVKTENFINTTESAMNTRHPLIDNTNTLQSAKDSGVVFEKLLSDSLPLFSQHTLDNLIVFPASGYLEMALAAAKHFSAQNYSIKNVVLIKPLFYSGEQSLFMSISSLGDELQFEAYTLDGDTRKRHLTGKLFVDSVAADYHVEISLIQSVNAMSAKQFYNLLGSQKIGYDAYFRCIDEVVGKDDQVVAKFSVNDSVAAEMHLYKVHPVIIDCAFQALASFAVDFGENHKLDSSNLKLPFEIGRISYVKPVMAAGYFVGKKLSNEDGYEVVITDHVGLVCATLSGIKLRPMPQFAAISSQAVSIAAPDSVMSEVMARISENNPVDNSVSDLVGQFNEVEDFAALLILQALKNLGLNINQGGITDLDNFQNSPQIDNRYRNTLAAFLHVIERKGWLKKSASTLTFVASGEVTEALQTDELEKKYISLKQQLPKVAAHLQLLWVCAEYYVAIIQGKKLATDVMFPGGSMSMLEAVYKGNEVADFFNSQARFSVEAFVTNRLKQFSPEQKLRLLEVGSGTGGTSLGIMESLLPFADSVDFVYTDISLGFVQFGRKQYSSRFNFAEFKTLNIENNLATQGFADNSCDVIIAANVLHATRNISSTIQQIRRLLKPGGLLVLNEVTQFQNFTAATFGLLDGWWAFNDIETRIAHSPLLNEHQWQFVLESNGFKNIGVHQPFNSAVSQRVIVAQCTKLVDASELREETMELNKHNAARVAVTPNVVITKFTPSDRSAVANEARAAYVVDNAVKDILQIDIADYDSAIAFADYGVDSVLAVDIMQRINNGLGLELSTTSIFDYPTPAAMAQYIAEEHHDKWSALQADAIVSIASENSATEATASPVFTDEIYSSSSIRPETTIHSNLDVAVIGMSGAFPGAKNLAEFWKVLSEGRNTITEVPADRWSVDDWFDADVGGDNRSVSKWGGFLEEMALFDPRFFNISPSEAEYIDPQHRQFLKHAWNALEDAGYSNRALDNTNCGVYAGCKAGDYTVSLKEHEMLDSAYAFTGNAESILAARLAYFLNLKGPALAIDTSCSSSLVAIHQACESLRNGEIDMAIAGGVAALSRPEFLVMASKAGMLSDDGHCWSFDDRANGIVLSEGVGVVLLKPMHAAVRDGDRIHAVIKASGINQDGSTNGITAPNGPSQTALIRKIYSKFNIDPDSIQQIEAHGTGTPLGDPIEFSALTNVFAGRADNCVIGSVKSNIGHGMASAGMAGLFKLILSAQHRKLVPIAGFERANKNLNLNSSPFSINTQLIDWNSGEKPRRAAVSSFGFSGTNAHIVVEEAPKTSPRFEMGRANNWLFVFTARSKAALKEFCQSIYQWLENLDSTPALENIAYTLLVGRTHHQFRISFVAATLEELSNKLHEVVQQSPDNYTDIRNVKFGAKDVDQVKTLITDLSHESAHDIRAKLDELSIAFNHGVKAPWDQLYDGKGRVVSLPTYPFARERYWVGVKAKKSNSKTATELLFIKDNVDTNIYFYEPKWEKSDTPTALIWPPGQYLFITTDPEQLKAMPLPEQQVSVILNQTEYARLNDHTWSINQANESHFARLIDELSVEKRFPKNIIHLLPNQEEGIFNLNKSFEHTVYSVRHLLFALCKKNAHDSLNYILGYDHDKPDQRPVMQAASGFALSLLPIMPVLKMAVMGLSDLEPGMLSARLRTELNALSAQSTVTEIKYIHNQRYILLNKPADVVFETVRLTHSGVYLISGGAGGLGKIFARYLMREHHANVVLLGRSPRLTQEVDDEFKSLPGRHLYISVDVTNPTQLQQAISKAVETFGPLTGVIHAAGIKNSKALPEKSFADFSETLAAKVKGAVLLDELTQHFPLDFFVLFSSAASLLGDFGEADYAVSNRFLDSFADWREAHRTQGHRQGITKSFNWPLWQGGGMSWKGGASGALYLNLTGFTYLDEPAGVKAFIQGLNSKLIHIFPATGNLEKLNRTILKQIGSTLSTAADSLTTTDIDTLNLIEVGMNTEQGNNLNAGTSVSEFSTSLKSRVTASLIDILAKQFKLPRGDIHIHDNFGNLGADSISLKTIATTINQTFAIEIVPSVFFTYADIASLVDFIVDEHTSALTKLYDGVVESEVREKNNKHTSEKSNTTSEINPEYKSHAKNNEKINHEVHHRKSVSDRSLSAEPIAVIGIDGVFPGSPNLDTFWKNLAEETDLVTEIPPERWDWREFFGDPNTEKNKMRSKWGAFIADMDKFDAAFFGISPREADFMDPQHRLFLQVAWHAIENAGYNPSALSGRKVGVFAGIQFNDYQSLLSSDDIWNERVTTGCAHAMVANRVSYLLNLRGPSQAINTACSSGLIAVHRAIKSIQDGEVEMAIAGGVSLILSPYNMLSAGVLDILAPDGRCKTFDKDANGYVKGEGVGAILLKSLKQAEADGDHIHCIISGSAENHGGHATSLTAPNGSAQAELIISAVEKAGIDVATIGYIETHGTGTELGDPTEVDGLKRAFKALARNQDKIQIPYCGLGTVKTNIGHLEPAAGIAGLLKVILAIKHKTLPGNPHFRAINPYIKLENSPFFVIDRTQPWITAESGSPRRAGISSFGFGGANAHVVVEEYLEQRLHVPAEHGLQKVFPFSAVNEDRLKAYAKNFLAFISASLQIEGQEVVDYSLLRILLESFMREQTAAILGVSKEELQFDESFETLGLDKLNLGKLMENLNKQYGFAESDNMIFSQVSLVSLCDQLMQTHATTLANYHDDCRKFVPNPQSTEETSLDLERVAYTLQTGRKAHVTRVAFTAVTIYELKEKLTRFIDGRDLQDIFTSNSESAGQSAITSDVNDMFDGDEFSQLIFGWVKSGKTEKLAKLWAAGVSIPWSDFYSNAQTPKRIPLPVYPFALNRHWFKQSEYETETKLNLTTSARVQISEVEQNVIDIWKSHLGVATVELDNDFLALGGDSIISTKITSAIEQQFNIKIPAGKFMKASTVREVAKILNESFVTTNDKDVKSPALVTSVKNERDVISERKSLLNSVPSIVREDRISNLLSSGQQRFWFLNKLHPNNPAFNISAALKLEGPIAIEAINEAYTWMVARHEVFRTVFNTKDGLTQQNVKLASGNPMGFSDLRGNSSQEQKAHIAEFINQPFNLEKDSLLRAGIVQLDTDTWVLKVVVHHIISDVWSVGILFRELLTRYLEITEGRATNIPAVVVHFGDYSRWQQANLDKVIESELPFWKTTLANAPDVIQLPFDHPRQDVQTFESSRITTKISANLHAQLKAAAQQQKVSLYVFLFTAFNVLLAKLTKQTDILVGSPVANRRVPETENMIGFLANTLVFRNDLSGDPSFVELTSRVQQRVFDAFDHQSVPFSKVVEAVRPKRLGNANPLFQVMFNMFPPMIPAESGAVKISSYSLTPDKSDYDLVMNIEERAQGIECQLDYNRNLFNQETANLIATSWLAIIEAVAVNADINISQLQVSRSSLKSIASDAAKAIGTGPASKVFITSTFVAEPITQALTYWTKRYALADAIEFADYNQVFPQLLDPAQGLLKNSDGYNLVLINVSDWVRFDKAASESDVATKIEKILRDFIAAMVNASAHAKSPLVVLLCPPSEKLIDSQTYKALEQLTERELSTLPNTYVLSTHTLLSRYPVAEIYDHRADEQAHIPYTGEFFAALATATARMLFSLKYKAHKVIVLDCDNTLWKGIVGEDGLRGIELDEQRRRWQELLIKQQAGGKLLCLCSKNNSDEVFEVLDVRDDMPLKREHLVSYKINWNRKSDNIRELARELNLGLESFIFIDDNPAEIEEVKNSLPEVLSLCFPQEPHAIESFMKDTWVFDQLVVTQEDQSRTQMYRENADRERFRNSTTSYAEFLSSLNLNITIEPLTNKTLTRVSQLTYRTNQFNFSGLRRSEQEIREVIEHGKMECLALEVSDRFGDYGLVGTVIFGQSESHLIIDTFLMSCRVLGKGVEHRMINELGRIAQQRNLTEILFYFSDSKKNAPAKQFIESIPECYSENNNVHHSDSATVHYHLPTAIAIELTITIQDVEQDQHVIAHTEQQSVGSYPLIRTMEKDFLLPWNAKNLINQMLGDNSLRLKNIPEKETAQSDNTELESVISAITREELGIAQFGRHDNFFDLGAHSSLLVNVASKLETQLNREIAIVKLFQYPTVASLAQFLSSGNNQDDERQNIRDKGRSQRKKLLQLRQAQALLETANA